jgi:hypothetical protein
LPPALQRNAVAPGQRAEGAMPDHGGGICYYLDEALAMDATKRDAILAVSGPDRKKATSETSGY